MSYFHHTFHHKYAYLRLLNTITNITLQAAMEIYGKLTLISVIKQLDNLYSDYKTTVQGRVAL